MFDKIKFNKKYNLPKLGKPMKTNVRTFEINTYIGKKTTVNGSFNSEDTIKVDGAVYGDISTAGDLIVGNHGVVEGNISANNVVISGNVVGNIKAADLISLTKTAKLKGDVSMKSFLIDEGAVFEGNSHINKEANETAGEVIPPEKNKDAANDNAK